jgi:hypothetical protein
MTKTSSSNVSAAAIQNAVAQAAITSGNAPGCNPLTVGAVKFNSSETPVNLPIGVEQMLSTQTLPGGSRVVQTFGVSPKPITWSGLLFGAFIEARVAQMRLYAAAGNPIKMTWVKSTSNVTGATLQTGQASTPLSQLKEKYIVIIKDFDPDFYAQYAKYTMTLIVVKALNGAYSALTPNSIDTQINTLQSNANSITVSLLASSGNSEAAIASVNELAASMNAVNASISQATPVSQNPLSGPNIQQTIQSAQSAISAFQALQNTGSSGFAKAIQLSGTLTAISRNVAAGYSPQSVQQQGGNLFGISAQQYGDVSQAFTLAKVAGFPSPFLPSSAIQSILLPNISTKPQTNQSTNT